MEDFRLIAIAALVGSTCVLWLLAAARGRVSVREVMGGVRNGLSVAVILGAATATLTYIVVGGLSEALQIALPMGFVVGASFLWIGLTLMPIGLFFGGGRDWARYGAWAAVAVIVVSLGLGWTAYTAYQEGSTSPRSTPSQDLET